MIESILDKAGKGIVSAIQDNIFKANKNASGQTVASLKYDITESDKGFTLLVDAVRHFPVLEKGRKPGKMPPVDKILGWTRDKGLPDGAAWGISKAIAKNGTKLFQKGGRKDIYSNVITDDKISSILQEVLDAFTEDAFNQLSKESK